MSSLHVSSRRPRGTLYPQKLALTSPTSGGRSVGIVRLRTRTTQFSFSFWCDEWLLFISIFLCLIVDVNSVVGLVHLVGVGDVANGLEVHVASIFMVEACELGEFLCTCPIPFKKKIGEKKVWGLVLHLRL
jgi:hypothetical protein